MADPDPDAPRKVTIDNQTVEGHSLKEQLDAADRTAAKTSVRRKGFGIRRGRILPGDAA